MPQPVLFIPGYPGSRLDELHPNGSRERFFLTAGFFLNGGEEPLLEGPDDLAAQDAVRAGEPIRKVADLRIFDLGRQAGSLYRVLGRLGVTDVEKLGWDWRRPVWDDAHEFSIQNRLIAALRRQHQRTGQRVTVIAHSTGGLVLRHALETRGDEVLPHLRRLVALGVPWAGVMRTLHYLQGEHSFFGIVRPARAQQILSRSWAAFDLVPPDPTHLADPVTGAPLNLVYREAGGVRTAVDPLAERGWLQVLPAELRGPAVSRAVAAADPARGRLAGRRPRIDTAGGELEIVNVVGWGWPTQVDARASGDGDAMRLAVASPTSGDSEMGGGDGTVARRSAAWIAGGDGVTVRTYHLPVGFLSNSRKRTHTALWMNPGARDLLAHLLRGDELPPFTHAALDAEALDSGGPDRVRVRAVALDAGGEPLANAQATVLDVRGGPIDVDFHPDFHGRALFRVAKSDMTRGSGAARFFRVQISWQEGGERRAAKPISFLFAPRP
jgi:hypothetical protein